ncbi:MAG: hypothetical protein J6X05_02745 [Bacteroidales bacterium]|nr:hypothetical protein [Bacteroidales bacterium]
MRRICLVAVIMLIANALADAQTIILRDTVRLRDSTAIVVPIEPSQVAKLARGIVDLDEDDDNAPQRRNFLSDSIKSDGFVSQSFASGNRRDLSPNTTADLRLNAKVAGGITVDAEILDSDMPMDDDGVTNQINELSTVRITASKDSTRLSIGDIVAVGDDNSLARFSKKIKGLEFITVNGLNNGDTIAAHTDFAATKGKFRRQHFFGKDNSQGPYYLTGNDSTTSVIVLIGTEKVFLDGNILIRGEEADYQIDYNAGCITFNIKHIITSQSSIVVDFEYSETQYNNYFIYAETQYQHRGIQYSAGYMSEYDGLGAAADSAAMDSTMARPRRSDYIFLGVDGNIKSRTNFNLETAFSKLTADRLQPSATTDRATAFTADLEQIIIKNDTTRTLSAHTNWRYFSKNFVPLTTEKNVDFQEKWDLQNYNPGGKELFSTSGISFVSSCVDVNYNLLTAKIDGEMDGVAHQLSVVNNYKKIQNTISADYYNDNQSETRHEYLSFLLKSEYKKDSLSLGASLSQKSRSRHDSITPNYRDISAFAVKKIKNGNVNISITDRTNFDDFFCNYSNATTFIKGELTLAKPDKFSLQMLEVFRKDRGENNKQNSLTGRINGSCQLFDHQLIIAATQQSENGNQEQLAYKYIRTTAGNGHYAWNDYDGDGIEDLNEFEISYYKTDADYVKYFVHTGKYINTLQNDWNLNVSLNPKRGDSQISSLISRISMTANIDFRRQDARRDGSGNLLKGDSLISKISRQNYTSRIRILDFLFVGNNWSGARQHRLTYYGLDDNNNETSVFFVEMNFAGGFSTKIQRGYKIQKYFSEYFIEKCYRIRATEDKVDFKYEFPNGLTLGLGASNCDKKNKIDTTTARIRSMNFTVNYTRENKGTITFDSRLIKNKYDDHATTGASSYQMLEGLNNGINGVVTINANYMITKYLQLSLLYELRASKVGTLHTGEMALKLIF